MIKIILYQKQFSKIVTINFLIIYNSEKFNIFVIISFLEKFL